MGEELQPPQGDGGQGQPEIHQFGPSDRSLVEGPDAAGLPPGNDAQLSPHAQVEGQGGTGEELPHTENSGDGGMQGDGISDHTQEQEGEGGKTQEAEVNLPVGADGGEQAQDKEAQTTEANNGQSQEAAEDDPTKGSLRERIDNASSPAEVLKAFLELSKRFTLEGKTAAQAAVAERLLALGDTENAMKFTILSEQGGQILEQRYLSELNKKSSEDMLEAGNVMRSASYRNEETASSMTRSARTGSESAEDMRSSSRRISEAVADLDQISRRFPR